MRTDNQNVSVLTFKKSITVIRNTVNAGYFQYYPGLFYTVIAARRSQYSDQQIKQKQCLKASANKSGNFNIPVLKCMFLGFLLIVE
jgi:hypothetical protein